MVYIQFFFSMNFRESFCIPSTHAIVGRGILNQISIHLAATIMPCSNSNNPSCFVVSILAKIQPHTAIQ